MWMAVSWIWIALVLLERIVQVAVVIHLRWANLSLSQMPMVVPPIWPVYLPWPCTSSQPPSPSTSSTPHWLCLGSPAVAMTTTATKWPPRFPLNLPSLWNRADSSTNSFPLFRGRVWPGLGPASCQTHPVAFPQRTPNSPLLLLTLPQSPPPWRSQYNP